MALIHTAMVPVPGLAESKVTYDLGVLEAGQMVNFSCERYPQEACGAILVSEGGRTRAFLLAHNVSRHPERAFKFDRLSRRGIKNMREKGHKVEVLWHSHTNGQVTLSNKDKRQAAPFGMPVFPDCVYIIVAIAARPNGTAWTGLSGWTWDYERGDFVPVKIRQVGVTIGGS